MNYLITGDPREIERVIQENRIRIARGVIKFTPYEPAGAESDTKEPIGDGDAKEPIGEIDEKAPKTKRSKKSE